MKCEIWQRHKSNVTVGNHEELMTGRDITEQVRKHGSKVRKIARVKVINKENGVKQVKEISICGNV